ncbi:MAG: VanZ family protein [Eubacterium sp.]|nr:VanZ family protein [Eubacterium sp.]
MFQQSFIIDREPIFIIEMGILLIYAIIMLIRKVKFKRLVLNLAFGFYIAVIIAICFFPMASIEGLYIPNSFIPFKSTIESISESLNTGMKHGFIAVFGNFVMLMPLGVFYSIYVKNFKLRFLYVFLFSVSIETMQFIVGLIIGCNYRSTDIDDVILNTAGGIIGILLFSLLKKIYLKLKKA